MVMFPDSFFDPLRRPSQALVEQVAGPHVQSPETQSTCLCNPTVSDSNPSKRNSDEFWTPLKEFPFSSQGQCILFLYKPTKELFVCKFIKFPMDESGNFIVPDEVATLVRHLGKHDRIIDMVRVDYYRDEQLGPSLTLLMEYCDGGDLFDVMRKRRRKFGGRFPKTFLVHVFVQLAEALAYIHHGLKKDDRTGAYSRESDSEWQPVVHCDLKPENVFLRTVPGQIYPDIVLGDFGLAALETDCPERGFAGTNGYMPPEFSEDPDAGNTTMSDVWMLGAVIHFLGTGKYAQDGVHRLSPATYDYALDMCMQCCLRRRPQDRPTAETLVRCMLPALMSTLPVLHSATPAPQSGWVGKMARLFGGCGKRMRAT
ncbi:hypothetical protein LTR50_007176 [Elasticomyces elasticus]|nr:hypothetical protein LTR50_007176 [Elasticomyces elasticus]